MTIVMIFEKPPEKLDWQRFLRDGGAIGTVGWHGLSRSETSAGNPGGLREIVWQ